MALASSGSRSSISSIEPLMSANSAVTVLRSPSTTAEEACSVIKISAACGGSAGEREAELLLQGAVLVESELPQSLQKRLPEGLSAPHFGQCCASGEPQSPQNFLPPGLSRPH